MIGCHKYHNIISDWQCICSFLEDECDALSERAGGQLFEEEDNAFTDGDHSHCLFTAHSTLALSSRDIKINNTALYVHSVSLNRPLDNQPYWLNSQFLGGPNFFILKTACLISQFIG